MQNNITLHRCAQVRAPLGAFPVSYKYALRDSDGVLTMEHGENRTASLPEGALPSGKLCFPWLLYNWP